ncbi:MAG: hypothetical protein LBI61_03880 [Puniceicoccales bacterium]|jgi:hypothetical protein|nr:hypothetical protein [Puniceicoccales bacterium]
MSNDIRTLSNDMSNAVNKMINSIQGRLHKIDSLGKEFSAEKKGNGLSPSVSKTRETPATARTSVSNSNVPLNKGIPPRPNNNPSTVQVVRQEPTNLPAARRLLIDEEIDKRLIECKKAFDENNGNGNTVIETDTKIASIAYNAYFDLLTEYTKDGDVIYVADVGIFYEKARILGLVFSCYANHSMKNCMNAVLSTVTTGKKISREISKFFNVPQKEAEKQLEEIWLDELDALLDRLED